jgi:heat shock factor-binding protein 1
VRRRSRARSRRRAIDPSAARSGVREAVATLVWRTPSRGDDGRRRDARAAEIATRSRRARERMSTRSAPTRGDAMTRDAGDDAMTSEALATFTQGLLEQMQGRFQTMSDAIITKIDEMQEKIEALERSVEEIASETREGK